jgi:DNA-binding beta-propeller fold protein YncE
LVVVTDTVLRKAFIFNLPRQKMYQFGHLGKKGVVTKPMGVAVGLDNRIYIADVSARKVFVYDAYGMFKLDMGGVGEFDRPVDVAVSPDGKRVYVVDAGGIRSKRHRVVVYDDNGVKLGEFGLRGEGVGEFNLPTQVAVAPDGTVYVLDAGNFRVQAFSAEGKFLRAWGRVGRAFGDFARPRGLAVGGDGNVYVTDAAFRNVQVFNPQGQLLLAIGGESIADKPGQYVMPAGVAVDELGHVYVVDQAFAKVDVFKRLSKKEMGEIVARRRAAK